jgi:glycosyltransferase involved in cell wall biosynthesis
MPANSTAERPKLKPEPLVSVIIPTCNRPDYLRVALRSVVAQTYKNLEIIVQDNASLSDPADLVAGFGNRRIPLYRNATNIGLRGNFLAGYVRATGKYVTTLSDDDVWHPDFLEWLVAALERDDDLVLAFCDHEVIDGEGRVNPWATEETTRRWGRHLLREGVYRPFHDIALVRRSICTASAAVLRRDTVDFTSIPAEIGDTIDLYVAYLAARTGRGCYYSSRRLAQYRHHAGSTTRESARIDRRTRFAHHAIFYWDRFRRDSALRKYRRYFALKRDLNAALILVNLLRKREVGTAWRRFRDFLGQGYLSPMMLLSYIEYSFKLRRLKA